MSRFKTGDRVEIANDVGPYPCTIGIIAAIKGDHPASLFKQFIVKLADGTEFAFFDFQLEIPPLTVAHTVLDSAAVTTSSSGLRGASGDRQVRLVAKDCDIHIKIRKSADKKSVLGQLGSGTSSPAGLIVVLFEDQIMRSVTTDDLGQFTFDGIDTDSIKIEFLLPKRRILATIDP